MKTTIYRIYACYHIPRGEFTDFYAYIKAWFPEMARSIFEGRYPHAYLLDMEEMQ